MFAAPTALCLWILEVNPEYQPKYSVNLRAAMLLERRIDLCSVVLNPCQPYPGGDMEISEV